MPICNTTLTYSGDLAPKLLESQWLEFEEVKDRRSDTILRYRTRQKFKDFSFMIYPGGGKVYMKGSWAKFHNEGLHNYSRYTVVDFTEDITSLSEVFGFDFFQGLLHSLEAGVNLPLEGLLQPYFSPEYLLPRIISYQGRKLFGPMTTIRGKGLGIQCELSNYRLKIYDKGLQYHLPEKLLRVEYDCHSVKELQPMGIRTLADLTDPAKLQQLGRKVHRILAESILIEPVDYPALSAAERKLYGSAERPLFWWDLTPRDRFYHFGRFRSMMETYSTYRLKDTLAELTRQEWDRITHTDTFFGKVAATREGDTQAKDCNKFSLINCGKHYNSLEENNRLETVPFRSSSSVPGNQISSALDK
ncbi:hypothetical protein [Larkinella soli]|uniref:hypothetical protein n=1 Tax=Larkinella soli TaxID=1770527 RepID=UPI000FFCBF44|nr:hypothetical protein [Larkinella soli]